MKMYTRSTDNAEMIEVAPCQYVNVKSALALKLVTKEQVDAARRQHQQQQAA
jgi:hypothetical protein